MAFRILRLCIPTQITHLLRSTPPRATQAAAARLDEEVIKGFVELMGAELPPEGSTWRDIVQQRILLPIGLGGMGLTHSTDSTAPAFIGSLALTCNRIVFLEPDLELHLHKSLKAWGYDALVERLGIMDPNMVLPMKEALHVQSIPKLQGKLTEVITKAKWQRQSNRLPFVADGAVGYDPVLAAIRESFGHCSKGDRTCNAWVTANPVSKRNRLTDMEFLRGCQIRLALPVRDPRARGIVCGKKGCVQHLFDFIDHELKCEVAKGGRTIRHSSKTTRPPGFRADFSVTMAKVEYLVDLTVHCVPLGKHREIGSIEQREHEAKLQKYSARYLPSTTAKVVPLSCSTFGSMAKKGTDFLESLAKHIAHTRCVQTIDKLRGGREAVRMKYSKQLRNLSEMGTQGLPRLTTRY
jgi:hypothetical protein